jgi:hypothetical protein
MTIRERWRGPAAAIALAVCAPPLAAQNCTPDSITLASQAEVDAFQTNHGPCTVLDTLIVAGANITNLGGLSDLEGVRWLEVGPNPVLTSIAGLSSLVSVTGPLFIQANPLLTNVTGLSGLTGLGGALILESNASLSDVSALSGVTTLGGSLVVMNNDALASFDSLSSLTTVGGPINIVGNDALTSIAGLSGLTDFHSALNITDNPQLASLQGLPAFTNLAGLVLSNNDALIHVDELAGLAEIGNHSGLVINHNAMLANLDGLADLVSLDWVLVVTDNPMLDLCSALVRLLDAVDDADPGPGPGTDGIPDVSGDITIENNLTGCNSVEEILGTTEPTSTATVTATPTQMVPAPTATATSTPPTAPTSTPTTAPPVGPTVAIPTLQRGSLVLLAFLVLAVSLGLLLRRSG